MNRLLVNLLLALAWAAMMGDFGVGTIASGFLLGALVLIATDPSGHPGVYGRRAWRLVSFVGFYVLEIVQSNVRVARDVLKPKTRARPSVLAVPLEAGSDAEITLLANLVTMTPGTLSLDVSEDRSYLYVHAMFAEDEDEVRRSIREGLARRVREVFR